MRTSSAKECPSASQSHSREEGRNAQHCGPDGMSVPLSVPQPHAIGNERQYHLLAVVSFLQDCNEVGWAQGRASWQLTLSSTQKTRNYGVTGNGCHEYGKVAPASLHDLVCDERVFFGCVASRVVQGSGNSWWWEW